MLNIFVAIILAAGAAFAPQLQAQGYPNKPIRVLVGYAPGGSADAGIRPLAKVLEPLLGQPLVMEYKPGAAGGVHDHLLRREGARGDPGPARYSRGTLHRAHTKNGRAGAEPWRTSHQSLW